MTQRATITRSFPLVDLETKGRTVSAYAAVFTTPYEVTDFDGNYDEVINSKAFNRTIRQGAIRRAQPIFNHGLTIWGTPSERYSMPLGPVEEIRADTTGLLTVTRFANTPLADEVLELIASGAIRGYSFRGDIFRSAKPRAGGNGRSVIERMELGLKEFGPTPFPVNDSAAVVAVRSQLIQELDELDPDERADLLAKYQPSTPPDSDADSDTPPVPPPPVAETPDAASSIPLLELAQAQRHRRRNPQGVANNG